MTPNSWPALARLRGHLHISRERLTFNYGAAATVPSRALADAAGAAGEPSFSTTPYAEPRDWGYAGLLAFTTVVMMRPQDQIPGLDALHIANICALVGVGPMLFQRLARRKPVFRITAEIVGLFALGAAMLATVPFSIWPGGALATATDSYFKALVVFILMMNTLTTPARLSQITWLILLCLGYVATRGVVDYGRGVNLIENGRLNGAVNGIFGNPNDLALTMVTFLPPAIVIALSRHNSIEKRLTATVIAALMLATIVLTKSRGGMLGLVAALIVLVLIGARVRRGFPAMLVAALLLASPFAPSSYWTRMASTFDEQQDAREFTGSREARRIDMQEGIKVFLERPFTGVGVGQFQNYDFPGRRERWHETHNSLIQVASETGVFGLVAFSFLIIRCAMAAVTTRRMLWTARSSWAAVDLVLPLTDRGALYAHTTAMTAGLAGWFVGAMFASVAYGWTFYYVLALVLAARELTGDRLAAAQVLIAERSKSTVMARSTALPPRERSV
jgi:O-antigen ligase